MRGVIVVIVVLCALPVAAFDSECERAGTSCTSLEAARTMWNDGEHGAIWRRARAVSGLPDAVDETFVVTTPVYGDDVDDPQSPSPSAQILLAPAPLDEAGVVVERTLDLATMTELPDFSFALWDWVTGNEACPPSGISD